MPKYFVEEMLCGSSVKGETKHKSPGYERLKEQYLKKVFTKSNVSKGPEMCFWLYVV